MSRRREELAPGLPGVIVMESYVASDRPTIHIDVQDLARLNELESAMRSLASGNSQSVELSQLKDAHWVAPLKEILLIASEQGADIKNEDRGERLVCMWTESIEGWLESAEKLTAMAAFGKPCHQYFDGSHADSVTIELAFLE